MSSDIEVWLSENGFGGALIARRAAFVKNEK